MAVEEWDNYGEYDHVIQMVKDTAKQDDVRVYVVQGVCWISVNCMPLTLAFPARVNSKLKRRNHMSLMCDSSSTSHLG
jgi:hypothetical protein